MEHRRRLDQVLEPEFVTNLGELEIEEVRARRLLAHDVENELSYYRRLLHGRIDLLRFEQRRRSGEETRSIIDALASILSDGPSSPGEQAPRRLDTDLPPLPEIGRRELDGLLGGDVLLRLDSIDDTGLAEAIEALGALADRLSEQRRQVQQVEDTLSNEVGSRYRPAAEDVSS